MANPAHTRRRNAWDEGNQRRSIQPKRHDSQQNRQQLFFQPADDQEVAQKAINDSGQTMASGWPKQGDGYIHHQNANPHGCVIARATGQHQPAERQKHHAVGDQMCKAGVAEGSTQHSPPWKSWPHRQVPLPTKHHLVNQLLAPGNGKQQQRNQPAATHPQEAAITMMTPAGSTG